MKAKKTSWQSMILFALGSLAGAVLGIVILRTLLSAMAASAPGFWFVSRAAGVAGYVLLWASTAWGIMISSKAVKEHVSGAVAITLHNVTSWLALGLSAVHALSLLGDRIVPFSLTSILLPFTADYQPVLTGLGTLSLYVGLLVMLSFYYSKRLGYRIWRTIHALSYLMFVAVTVHGALLGTDSSTLVMQLVYALAAGSVLFLTLFRVLDMAAGGTKPQRAHAGRRQHSKSLG
jgi:predicted ferric reductase